MRAQARGDHVQQAWWDAGRDWGIARTAAEAGCGVGKRTVKLGDGETKFCGEMARGRDGFHDARKGMPKIREIGSSVISLSWALCPSSETLGVLCVLASNILLRSLDPRIHIYGRIYWLNQ